MVQCQVKDMVATQLTAAGFDPELSAADLTVRGSAMKVQASECSVRDSYAMRAAANAGQVRQVAQGARLRDEKREDKFWTCRRSLRLWPMKDDSVSELQNFLRGKLRMDEDFCQDIGNTRIKMVRERNTKVKNEAIVTFETKEIRDAVRARASQLAEYRDTAGMRLELPDYLQKDFRALMNLAYDLKSKNTGLKRNIKFDEEDLGLFMDIQVKSDGHWRRIKPDQARKMSKSRNNETQRMNDSDIAVLLGSPGDGETDAAE